MSLLTKIFGSYSKKELQRIEPIVDQIEALEEEFAAMSDEALKGKTAEFQERLQALETLDDILPEAFATVREAAWRVLGLKHFRVQLIGGVVLHQGRIAEMKTGEGKTLVATLPVYLNALSGKGVHVVTVNDYLARRDSEWMGKLYRFLGLSVGLVVNGMDSAEKKKAYAADITYGTNNEFGFDYLRDNMVIYQERMVQRGHSFAIVDEVDSILIDEARTPLIISGAGDESTDQYEKADKFVKRLKMLKVKETDAKEDDEDTAADYIVDEKAKTATLTKRGIKKAENAYGIENLSDMDNIEISHHINQALKAYGVMHRDIDYVVRDGEIIIVDEFTGRLMFGRRYSEGLHQAIEAKEGVKVNRESKTLATITFQNYFRLYDKLSGMTGTALTEEEEFREIYKLDVVEIPTNKPLVRKDRSDVIYKTEMAKFRAVIEQIEACHAKGQPVLVGTISIEKSELLSSLLKRKGIKHTVLNAKYHTREAEIIAQAGKPGAVTIATNMAGRGTDITLGGNADYMARAELKKQEFSEEVIAEATGFAETDDEDVLTARRLYNDKLAVYKKEIEPAAEAVKQAGGLFILGTERHESRRIDNQLRGRAGRQGDPGESRFFLSLEDDLMRLFAGDRVSNLMERMNLDEDTPIENKMLTKSIENAQKNVEARNFGIRKRVLDYDDVMNRQREVIYKQRKQVLDNENLRESIMRMIEDVVDEAVSTYTADAAADDWDFAGLREHFAPMFLTEEDLHYTVDQLDQLTREQVKELLMARASAAYEKREKELGDLMRELERVILLRMVDQKWMDHIDNMEELRRGIGLRAYGQHNPVVEYQREGSEMFDEMIYAIKEDTVRTLYTARVRMPEQVQRKQVAGASAAKVREMKTTTNRQAGQNAGGDKPQPRRVGKKVGRNDPCPCGSGKKYKKCCGRFE